MLSKNTRKKILELHNKKKRVENNAFIVEGIKGVNEFLNSDIELINLYHTEDFDTKTTEKHILVTQGELQQISNLKNPNKVLGVFEIPKKKQISTKGITLVLDQINDPGNLGTIIRLCDWFGIEQMICSENTVDCYNSKVIQSTMGSLTRVNIVYDDIFQYLKNTDKPVYATVLGGSNIHKTSFEKNINIVIGNEANGISAEVLELVNKKITIPSYSKHNKTESLNVAVATSIVIAHIKGLEG